MTTPPTVAWIILTMGDRPDELARATRSIRAQSGPRGEVVVVANGGDPGPCDADVVVTLEENVGIPEGRNIGAAHTDADVLFFLDDDATCATGDVATSVMACLGARPEVAVVALRIADPASGQTMRRHVPRLGGRADRSGDVTTFLGGACAIRAKAYSDAGGYPGEFRYSMEESDLAWRLLDRGWSIHYLSSVVVHHPATEPSRHGDSFVATARNRVWLARRRLPLPLRVAYVAVWSVLMVARAPSSTARRETLRGLRAGARLPAPAPIDHMSWTTAARMFRLGRPPIV